ncbi:MAG TPA: alpha/beta fold hydrolase [Polyangia bacterium]
MSIQFLFAPGAGAPSSSNWMRKFSTRLAVLGRVQCFDYPYQLAGRRSPDRLPVLLDAHRAAFDALDLGLPVVLIGKSMGGRIGCHLANDHTHRRAVALVCLGYPLVGQSGSLRDEVLLALRTPILFVQGSRDPLCPLDRLAEVRARMSVANELYVVESANHSLELTKTMLKASGLTQDAVDASIVGRISNFLEKHASSNHALP